MNKLVVETGINTKGIEDGIVSISELLRQAEEQIGRELTADEKKTIEEMYWDVYSKFNRLGGAIEKTIDKSTKGITKTVKGITRMGLAIFGIRSAFMLVRSAMSTITSQDAQLKADIDYMKNAIVYTLEPVIRKIVDWAKQLLFYLAYILRAWSNGKIDIFKGANKGLEKANKGAKELSKTMAGFDEMNVVGGSDGGSGSVSPSFNLSDKDGKVPEWLQWIADNGELIVATIAGIVTALTLVKLGVDAIMATGIGVAVAGIVYSVISLIEYINDPSWSKFGNIIIGIGVAVVGLGIAFLGLPAVIAGAIVVALGVIAKFWDSINEFLENLVNTIFTKGDDVMNWLQKHLGIFGTILNVFVGTVIGIVTSIIQTIRSLLDGLFTGVRQIIDGIIAICKGHLGEGLKTIFKGIANIIIGVLNALINGLNAIISPIRALIVAVGKVMGKGWTMDNIRIPTIPKLAKGGIINMPGRGVLLGGGLAKGGEQSPEGVIPLTDSQQMALLGEAIGRFVNINATIPVYVGNRLVLREMKRIEAEDNFAYNR